MDTVGDLVFEALVRTTSWASTTHWEETIHCRAHVLTEECIGQLYLIVPWPVFVNTLYHILCRCSS